MENLLRKMLGVDRRVIFLLIALATIIPLLLPYKQTIHPDKAAVKFYNEIKNLSKKTEGRRPVVIVSAEYRPGTVPEVSPMARAALTQLLRIDAKIIIMGLIPMGPPLIMDEFNDLLKRPEFRDKRYGVDYVNLGYTVGGVIVIKGFVREIRDKYPVDANGTRLDELPIMKDIHNFDDIDLIVSLTSVGMGPMPWIQFAKKTTDEKMDIVFGCTAVMAPENYPFLNSGQIKGLLGGLKGGADYEALINEPHNATKYMFAQSIAHIVIMLFIIIGNIAFFLLRRRA